MSSVIQPCGRRGSAQAATTSAKAESRRISKLRVARRSDRDTTSPSSGRIPRRTGENHTIGGRRPLVRHREDARAGTPPEGFPAPGHRRCRRRPRQGRSPGGRRRPTATAAALRDRQAHGGRYRAPPSVGIGMMSVVEEAAAASWLSSMSDRQPVVDHDGRSGARIETGRRWPTAPACTSRPCGCRTSWPRYSPGRPPASSSCFGPACSTACPTASAARSSGSRCATATSSRSRGTSAEPCSGWDRLLSAPEVRADLRPDRGGAPRVRGRAAAGAVFAADQAQPAGPGKPRPGCDGQPRARRRRTPGVGAVRRPRRRRT